MPSPGENLQYIQIKDFRPGISDNPGANYPPGSAQRAFTYRCIANRAGALIPLPLGQAVIVPPAEADIAAVVGLYLPPIPILPSSGATIDTFPPHELMVGTEIQFSGQRFHRLFRYRMGEVGNPHDVWFSNATADTTPPVSTPGGFNPAGMWFGTVRSNRASPSIPGVPIVVALWQHSPSFMYLATIPDDQNTGTLNPYFIFLNNAFLGGFTCHQGRVVVQRLITYGQGTNAITLLGENLFWSVLNDVTTANFTGPPGPTPDTVFVPENPSGFSFLFSMSANELFGVKAAFGGVYVSGDLTQGGTTVSLPMVTGSDISHTPCVSDMGVVYGSRTSGIWSWSHGDSSNLMSPQMDPLFWTLEPNPVNFLDGGQDDFGGNSYSLARCDDWVMTPNNWLYDTQLKSWWRLQDPGFAKFRWITSNFRYIYASVSWFHPGAVGPDILATPIFQFDRHVPTTNYSWQSHPLWETIDTLVDMREIVLRVKGTGTVTVFLTGESTTAPVQATVTVDSTVPVLIRTPIRIQDSNIAVRISAAGSASPPVAPTVYECNLGYIEAQKERTS